ncbi:PREDICTED: uncharacterized protein LOC109114147 [Nelumbo nucifera]|uniref:Uncharacterized protein LOC109114147 n=1 Tax=Nelumbo nucifera TaxID=4432 RepID=A0A1U8Q1J6_NELNU|nr:PREDICTED: uncharacterized protein LOC109114147 [Nelumbo nucifera]
MAGAKLISSPMSTSCNLSSLQGVALPNPAEYRSIVGALQYVTLTRPDISFSVNKVCRFLHAPTDAHWSSVKRILRYLKSTLDVGLHFTPLTSLQLHAFSDANWAGCPDDHKSTDGYCVYLGPNLIAWSAKKQAIVARSSTEAEFRALANLVTELLWFQSLLTDLGFPSKMPPVSWCDNIGTSHWLLIRCFMHAPNM